MKKDYCSSAFAESYHTITKVGNSFTMLLFLPSSFTIFFNASHIFCSFFLSLSLWCSLSLGSHHCQLHTFCSSLSFCSNDSFNSMKSCFEDASTQYRLEKKGTKRPDTKQMGPQLWSLKRPLSYNCQSCNCKSSTCRCNSSSFNYKSSTSKWYRSSFWL